YDLMAKCYLWTTIGALRIYRAAVRGRQCLRGQAIIRTRPVKAAEMVIDNATGGYAAALASCAGFQFQGRSSSIRLAGWSCSRARTSVSQACGSTSLSLAVS